MWQKASRTDQDTIAKERTIKMKANIKGKKSYVKKTMAAILVVLFIAGGCLLSTAAAAERWSWTVNVSATGTDSASINAAHSGTRTDTFGSYITVYNNKSYTQGIARVYRNGHIAAERDYNFSANSPSHPTINFGNIPSGPSQHHYANSYGGFRSPVDTYQYY